jgi:hypothetical protein
VAATVEDETPAEETLPVHYYDVRLHFACLPLASEGRRVFDVYAQDELVLREVTLDPTGESGQVAVERLLERLPIAGTLQLRFVAKEGAAVLSGIEIEKRP